MRDVRAIVGASARDGARDGARRSLGLRGPASLDAQRTEARGRRTQPPRRGGWRGARVVLLALAAAGSAGTVVAAGELLSRADALPIRTLAVRGAEGALADEVRAYAALPIGTPLFAVKLDEVAARVLEHPYVRAAEVRRLPPDSVEISVRVRAAVALVQVETLYLVDELGVVFKAARVGDGLDLPVITGLREDDLQSGEAARSIDAALSLVRAHAAAGAPGGEIAEVNVDAAGELALVLGSGARVHLGLARRDEQTADQLARLAVIVARLESAGQQASSIRLDDERRPERAAVRLRPVAETLPGGG